MRRIIRFPLTRIVLGALFVIVPVAALQLAERLAERTFDARGATWLRLLFAALTLTVVIGAYRLLVRWLEGRAAAELAATGAAGELAAGAAVGALLFLATIGTLWALGCYHVAGGNAWSTLLPAFTLAAVSAVLEEVVVRGLLFRIMEESLGTWIALAISALLFGAAHSMNPHASITSSVAIALEAGLLLAAAYVVTRRLWLPIGLHFAWNFTQGGIFGVAVSGHDSQGLLRARLEGPEWLTGGAFGAEASIVAVAVCLAVFVVLIQRARKLGRMRVPFWQQPNVEVVA